MLDSVEKYDSIIKYIELFFQRISDSNGWDSLEPNKFQAYHLKPLGQFSYKNTIYVSKKSMMVAYDTYHKN